MERVRIRLFSTGSCSIVLTHFCFHWWSLSLSRSCGRRCIILHLSFCQFLKGVRISLLVSLNFLTKVRYFKGMFDPKWDKNKCILLLLLGFQHYTTSMFARELNSLFWMKSLPESACQPRRLPWLFVSRGITLIHDHAFLFQNLSSAAQIYTDGEKHRCLDADADRLYQWKEPGEVFLHVAFQNSSFDIPVPKHWRKCRHDFIFNSSKL